MVYSFDRACPLRLTHISLLFSIIDGSGVIHDPAGLDRAELIRLAKGRKMISNFDAAKLGPQGYRVLCDEASVTLPCERHFSRLPWRICGLRSDENPLDAAGEVVTDCTEFRNVAHFRYKADIFVPCGGRPEAINITNVSQLWDSEGRTKFKYIVEGANLFLTAGGTYLLSLMIPEMWADCGFRQLVWLSRRRESSSSKTRVPTREESRHHPSRFWQVSAWTTPSS